VQGVSSIVSWSYLVYLRCLVTLTMIGSVEQERVGWGEVNSDDQNRDSAPDSLSCYVLLCPAHPRHLFESVAKLCDQKFRLYNLLRWSQFADQSE